MTSLTQILNYGSRKIEYDIVKSKRIKTSEIIIDENKIVVRTPMNKSLEDSKKMIESKASWILKKQLEYKNKEHKMDIIRPTFENNSYLAYLGKNIKLNVCYSAIDRKFELKHNQFYANSNEKASIDLKFEIRSLYENWIKQQAIKILEPKVLKYSRIIKVKSKNTKFKDLKNRWGSVTKDGTLNLNLNLVKAPEDVIDYLIIHELCHLRIKEHSHHYWNLVRKYCSDYNRKVEWLEINGKNLLL
ncbi:MAG: SprT family zinc-dependent metalloprotease [Nitrososphaeraceae archaeon]